MQSMLGDGLCDEGCNIAACDHDHGDCYATHPSWVEKLRSTKEFMSFPPQDSTLQLKLKLYPMTVLIDSDTGETYTKIRLEIESHWLDSRLFEVKANPALDVWARLVSLAASQAGDAQARASVIENMQHFAFPALSITDEYAPTTSPEGWTVALSPDVQAMPTPQRYRQNIAGFKQVPHLPTWRGRLTCHLQPTTHRSPLTYCHLLLHSPLKSCHLLLPFSRNASLAANFLSGGANGSWVQYEIRKNAFALQSFDYFYYPFDKQTVRFTIRASSSTPGFDLTDCGSDDLWQWDCPQGAAPGSHGCRQPPWMALLLPSTSGWLLARDETPNGWGVKSAKLANDPGRC